MLRVNNLNVKIGDRVLINKLSFNLKNGDKLAIIGEEGDGKSTLLKCIVNMKDLTYAQVSGTVNYENAKLGFLEQFLPSSWENVSVEEYLLKDDVKDNIDYFNFEKLTNITPLFAKVKLNNKIYIDNQLVKTLSGGEKIKLQLVKILLNKPDIILLDEPSNDLDEESLLVLEKLISEFNGIVIFISHDETLIENCANCVLHLEQVKRKSENIWHFEKMKYADYLLKRKQQIDRQESIALKQQEEIKIREEKWQKIYQQVHNDLNSISRQDPQGGRLLKKKMKSVKAQERRFEKIKENVTEFLAPEEAITLKFKNKDIPNNKCMLDFYADKLVAGDKVLANNVSLRIFGADRVVVTGKNGTGKTTLLNSLYETLKNQNTVYMTQNYDEILNKFDSVDEYIKSFCFDKEDITRAKTYLGGLKFTSEEMNAKISNLSGGQKGKLFLLKLVILSPDYLLLDEPTRNFSPLTNPVLRKVLKEYNGVLIAVSHDKKFIDEVGKTVYALTKNGLVKT